MFFLMNKDNIVATFETKPITEFTESNSYIQREVFGKLPIGYTDINAWLEGRKASKHNRHLQVIMRQLGCETNEGFIRMTHAASINDTFWVKNDREKISWKQVSLYRNEFTEIISQLAFEGIGLYDTVFSSTSPELTCEGSYRKCFRKEQEIGEFDSDIFIYKRGGELTGLEPYCESMCSEIAKIICPTNSVDYELVMLHDKLASRCNLFSNEKCGYTSFSKIKKGENFTLQDVFDYYESIGSGQQLREMLLIDALCFNQDRHAGNYGVMFDTDTLEVKSISPVFDLNLSLLPFARINDFENIGDYLFECGMKLGEDFTRVGQMAITDTIRDRVKDIKDFSFSFRGDDVFPLVRVKQLEEIINRQAKAILSKDKLFTKDVFVSSKAQQLDSLQNKVLKAVGVFEEFSKELNQIDFTSNVFISECISSDVVQCYIEKEDLMMNIDFLNGCIILTENMKEISFVKLKKLDEEFWKECLAVKKKLRSFVSEREIKIFSDYFKKCKKYEV